MTKELPQRDAGATLSALEQAERAVNVAEVKIQWEKKEEES